MYVLIRLGSSRFTRYGNGVCVRACMYVYGNYWIQLVSRQTLDRMALVKNGMETRLSTGTTESLVW